MQDRYAGDIGDYIKLALLRLLSPGRKLGVAWYLVPDEDHNADGRHISYLNSPGRWRHLDPPLFDGLAKMVARKRSTKALEAHLSEDTVFASEPLAMQSLEARDRSEARATWFERTLDTLSACDLVFADPDNGLVDDEKRRRRDRDFGKKLPLAEVTALAAGRTAVIYHHNSRRKGGHDAEVNAWLEQIGERTIAVRATAFSCRTFFLVNPDRQIADRTKAFCDRWANYRVRDHGSLTHLSRT